MAKTTNLTHPASTERLLEVLEEVRTGTSVSGSNGSPERSNGNGRIQQGGLESYYRSLSNNRSRIKDSVRATIDELFHEKRGIRSVVERFMAKETLAGLLLNRRQAADLKDLVTDVFVRVAKSRNRVSADFIRILKREFGHFYEYIDGLDLAEEVVDILQATRGSLQESVINESANHAPNGQHPDGGSGKAIVGSDDQNAEHEEELTQWHDPELREILVLEILGNALQTSFTQLAQDLRSSSSPVIGEHEEMDMVNFIICDQFVHIVQVALDAAAAESRTNADFLEIRKKFLKSIARNLPDLDRQAARDHAHAGVIPSIRKCVESIADALKILTQEAVESYQSTDGASPLLDGRKLFLPRTSLFLERREQNDAEEWQWSESDWHAFRKHFKFPEKGPALMQPLHDPSNTDLMSAAHIVNQSERAGLQDKNGQFVIRLSDAKKQIARLQAVHEERQIAAALPGVLQYAKDLYTERVVRSLLSAARNSAEEKGRWHELPDGTVVRLVGPSEFQMSWVPKIQTEIGRIFDGMIGEARTSPQEMAFALLDYAVENKDSTLQNLCEKIGDLFGVRNMLPESPPDTSDLIDVIEHPKKIYPYTPALDFGKLVDEVLLAPREDERAFPLLVEEKGMLEKALEQFMDHQTKFAPLKTYAELIVFLGQKGQPLATAAAQCNDAFHAGTEFRKPDGLLAEYARDILQDYPLTHEPTREEKLIARDIVAERQSDDKATRTAVLEAINAGVPAGQSGRSKTFVKELVDEAYDEWKQTRHRTTKPESASPSAEEIPESSGKMNDADVLQETDPSKTESADDRQDGDGDRSDNQSAVIQNLIAGSTKKEIPADLRSIFEQEYDVLEQHVTHAVSGKWGKGTPRGGRSHAVRNPELWLAGCVTRNVSGSSRADLKGGLKKVVEEYVYRRRTNTDMSKDEYAHMRASSVPPVPTPSAGDPEPAAVSDGHARKVGVAEATLPDEMRETQSAAGLRDVLEAAAPEKISYPEPAEIAEYPLVISGSLESKDINDAQTPADSRDAVDNGLDVAKWTDVGRKLLERIRHMVLRLPDAADLAELETQCDALREGIHSAIDLTNKTFNALEPHTTNVGRIYRKRQREETIDNFPDFTADYILLSQYLNTLVLHDKAIRELLDTSSACKELLEKTNEAFRRTHELQIFIHDVLPEIIQKQSPVALGLLDLDACKRMESVKSRLELLKNDVTEMHDLCGEGHKFKNEKTRKDDLINLEASLNAMRSLFKKITTIPYTSPSESTDLLAVSEQDQDEEEEPDPDDFEQEQEVETNTSNQSVEISAAVVTQEKSSQNNAEAVSNISSMMEKLDTHEQALVHNVLLILSVPSETGYPATGMKIDRLRKYLKGMFPNLPLPQGENGGQKDKLFISLEKVSELDRRGEKAKKEQAAEIPQKDWTKGKRKVDVVALAKASAPLLLTLNEHRNFVFALTDAGGNYLQELGYQLTDEQINLFRKVRKEERILSFRREE